MLQIKGLFNLLPTRQAQPKRVIIHGQQGPNEHGGEVAQEEATRLVERRPWRGAAKDGN
jgi:hypothetical protein